MFIEKILRSKNKDKIFDKNYLKIHMKVFQFVFSVIFIFKILETVNVVSKVNNLLNKYLDKK